MKRSGQKCDGYASFYKLDRAELVLEENIEYNDLVNFIQNEDSSNGNECNNDEHKEERNLMESTPRGRKQSCMHACIISK